MPICSRWLVAPCMAAIAMDSSDMGVKMLECFPFYRRCKERCKSKQCPQAAAPPMLPEPPVVEEEVRSKPRLTSTTSWSSESEGGSNRGSQVYYTSKARLSFRHQLDSNINAVDATY